MSEATLRQFLERLNGDASFRERAQTDPESAFAEFGLTPAEQDALRSRDEEALRRLAGEDVSGHFWYLASLAGYMRTQSSTPNVSEIVVTKSVDSASTNL